MELCHLYATNNLNKSLPHRYHHLLASLIFHVNDSKTAGMLLYNSFEDMQAMLSSGNALYIDFLNKMSGVVEEVMFLSENV